MGLDSVWFIQAPSTAEALYADIRKYMPLLELSDAVVDNTSALATDIFFGTTEDTGIGGGIADNNPGTRGLLESRPHDNIHRVVGGIIPGAAVGHAEYFGQYLS